MDPVLAYRRGSIPEIIDDGITGFICDDLNEMVAAVSRLSLIQRHHCRQAFEARFTVARMAKDYVALYENLLFQQSAAEPLYECQGVAQPPASDEHWPRHVSGERRLIVFAGQVVVQWKGCHATHL